MTLRPGEHPDELISASLTGDLTDAERSALAAHLETCDRCRETLAAFAQSRKLLSGMRPASPPRDLGARVRAGIESGSGAGVPWWRRPSFLGIGASLATVAAGVLAVVLLGNLVRGPVAQGTPTASASVSASQPAPTASLDVTPQPSSAETPAPSVSIDPNPVARLEFTLRDREGIFGLRTSRGTKPIGISQFGLPINAALSPDNDWVAFQVRGELSDLVDTYAYRISDETLVPLAENGMDSPFSRLAWSPDGRLLAFTAITESGSADVYLFSPLDPEAGARQLTNTGNAFAASFYGESETEAWLWVSTAGEAGPMTYRVAVPTTGIIDPLDPAQVSLATYADAFLPVLSTFGAGDSQPLVAYWNGEMARDDAGWHFSLGGMLFIEQRGEGGDFELRSDVQAFDTLTVAPGGQGFRSARFTWAPDGSAIAVWDAQWEGTEQPAGFPDGTRVYFAHPADGVYIGPAQAIDEADTDGGTVINVALAGGQYLAITVQTAPGAEGGSYGPTAELRLVTRNLGDVPDDVVKSGSDHAWYGPAVYPADSAGQ